MSKRKKKDFPVPPMRKDIEARFKALIAYGKPPKPAKTFLGFKTKNINQLYRWDTLEDVTF